MVINLCIREVIGPETTRLKFSFALLKCIQLAEYGVAAHWNHKDPIPEDNRIKFKWIQELVGILDEEEVRKNF